MIQRMYTTRAARGFAFMLTFMMIGLFMVLVTILVNREQVFGNAMRLALEQEKAKLLALSGLELAKSMLAHPPSLAAKDDKQADAAQPKEDPTDQMRDLLASFLTNDTPQTFTVVENKDTYGVITVVLGCEQGKLNINKLYDFTTHKFLNEGKEKEDAKILLQKIFEALQKNVGAKDLFAAFEKFLRERKQPLVDVTELLAIPEFAVFKDAVFPSFARNDDKKIYLTDIFTVMSNSVQIEPWLFSTSLKKLLELKFDSNAAKQLIKNELSKFNGTTTWSKDWDRLLKPVYGKEFNALNVQMQNILRVKFEPNVFSVVSYGSIKNVQQGLFAIIEKKPAASKDGNPQMLVKKLYWL